MSLNFLASAILQMRRISKSAACSAVYCLCQFHPIKRPPLVALLGSAVMSDLESELRTKTDVRRRPLWFMMGSRSSLAHAGESRPMIRHRTPALLPCPFCGSPAAGPSQVEDPRHLLELRRDRPGRAAARFCQPSRGLEYSPAAGRMTAASRKNPRTTSDYQPSV